MPKKKVRDSTQAFERARVRPQKKPYVLRLYVTGTTPQSVRAIANIKKLCEDTPERALRAGCGRSIPTAPTGAGRADHRRADAHQEIAAPTAPYHRRYVKDRARAGGVGFAKEGLITIYDLRPHQDSNA